MFFSKRNDLIRTLKDIIEEGVLLGVSEEATSMAKDYLNHDEFGLAFEQMVYELSENEIKITNTFFMKMKNAAVIMRIDESEYVTQISGLIM